MKDRGKNRKLECHDYLNPLGKPMRGKKNREEKVSKQSSKRDHTLIRESEEL